MCKHSFYIIWRTFVELETRLGESVSRTKDKKAKQKWIKDVYGCYTVNGNNTLGLYSVIRMKLGKDVKSKEFTMQSKSNYVHWNYMHAEITSSFQKLM